MNNKHKYWLRRFVTGVCVVIAILLSFFVPLYIGWYGDGPWPLLISMAIGCTLALPFMKMACWCADYDGL